MCTTSVEAKDDVQTDKNNLAGFANKLLSMLFVYWQIPLLKFPKISRLRLFLNSNRARAAKMNDPLPSGRAESSQCTAKSARAFVMHQPANPETFSPPHSATRDHLLRPPSHLKPPAIWSRHNRRRGWEGGTWHTHPHTHTHTHTYTHAHARARARTCHIVPCVVPHHGAPTIDIP